MANEYECTWCGNNRGSTWTKKIDNKKLNSKQKFCCLKHKTEYDDRYGIDWIEDQSKNRILVIIVIIIIFYILSKK